MYRDEYHKEGSLLAYDGELIPAEDAAARYERDKKIKNKYIEAEKNRDVDQLDWVQVKNLLR